MSLKFFDKSKTKLKALLMVSLVLLLSGSLWLIVKPKAEAAIPKIINFQGKLTKASDGTNVTNGSYNMQFKIYDAASSGNLLWTENWDATTTQVTLTSGVFNVKLGTYTDLSSVDFSAGSLYLTVNFNPGAGYDGEMSPRKQLTSSAFAFNANNLVGDGKINTTYTSTTSSAASITYNPASSTSTPAVTITSGSNLTGTALKVTQGGSGYAASFTGGSVGIGTTSPTATLFIQGTGATNPFSVASSTGTALLTVAPNGSTTISSLVAGPVKSTSGGSLYNGAINLASGSSDITGILTSTNGGIGTTTLGSLTVGTGLSITGGQSVLIGTSTLISLGSNVITTVTTGTSGTIFNISTSTNSLTINLPFASITNTGQLQAADWLTFNNKLSGSLTNGQVVYATGASTTASGSALLTNGTVSGVNATSSSISFNVQGSTTLDPFNVASSSGTSFLRVTQAGNVGIGSSSPVAPFTVSGSTASNYTSFAGTGSAGFELFSHRITATTTNTTYQTLGVDTAVSLTTNPSAAYSMYGLNSTINVQSSDTAVYPTGSVLAAGAYASYYNGSGTMPLQNAISAIALRSGTGTSTNVDVITAAYYNLGSGNSTTTRLSQLYLATPAGQASTTVTNSYGLYINDQKPSASTLTNPAYGVYQLGATNYNYFQGNVGVGSTTPILKLAVVGTAGNNDILDIASSTGTSILRVTSGSKVGIGTTTPGRTLTVAGDIYATGSLYDSTNSAGTYGMVLMSTSTGSTWVATSTLGISGGSGVTGGANGYVARFTSATALATSTLLDNGIVAGINATSSTATFNLQGSAGVNPLNIASSTGTSLLVVNQNGNVGIGTATPASLLQVAGDIRVGSGGNTVGNLILQNSANLNTVSLKASTTSASYTLALPTAQGSSGQLLQNDGSGNLSWATAGAATLSIGSTVTSGTQGSILFVNSGALAQDAGFLWDATNHRLGINSSSPQATLAVQGSSTDPTLDVLRIASSTGTQLLTVFANGNVGIGTSTINAFLGIQATPGGGQILDIASSSGTTIFHITANGLLGVNTGTPNSTLQVVGMAGSAPIFDLSSSSLTSLFRVMSNGKVGIGTSAPISVLSVNATTALTSNLVTLSNVSNSVTTAGVSNLQITYVGGSAAVEASAQRIDLTPGATSAGVWNGLQIAPNATGPVSGVWENGIKIGAPTPGYVGNYSHIYLDSPTTSTSSLAYIRVGKEVLTATNNLTTLIMQNGTGSGILEIRANNGYFNPRGINYFGDDFTGRVINTTNQWTATASGTGATLAIPLATTASTTNGMLRFTNGTVSGTSDELSSQAVASLTNGIFQRANNPMMELKFRPSPTSALTNFRFYFGFASVRVGAQSETFTAANYVMIGKRAADTQWQCITSNGSTQNIQTTGVNVLANTMQSFRIMLSSGGSAGQVICEVDGVATSTATSLPATTTKMDVYGKVEAINGFSTSNVHDMDYIRVWQDDPIGQAQEQVAQNQEDLVSNDDLITNADLAEYYPASLTNPPMAMDVVSFGSDGRLVPSINTTTPAGVISTNPYMTLGNLYGDHKPMVLAGRAPVKISGENGSVRVGDFLTTSKTSPGYAAKAVTSGQVIGQALEDFNPSANTKPAILAFIKPGYQNIVSALDLGSLTDKLTFSATKVVASPNDLAAYFNNATNINPTLPQLLANLEIVVPKIIVGGLEVNTIGSDKTIIKLLSDTEFFGRPYFNTDTAGFAIIKTGDIGVDIVFDKDYLEQPIVNASISADATTTAGVLTSFTENIFNGDIKYLVANKSQKGFRILLNKPAPTDIQFSWIALAVKNAKTFSSKDTAGQNITQNISTQNTPIAAPETDPNTLATTTPTALNPVSEILGTSTLPQLEPTSIPKNLAPEQIDNSVPLETPPQTTTPQTEQ